MDFRGFGDLRFFRLPAFVFPALRLKIFHVFAIAWRNIPRPAGTTENSPQFQLRVGMADNQAPQERLKFLCPTSVPTFIACSARRNADRSSHRKFANVSGRFSAASRAKIK